MRTIDGRVKSDFILCFWGIDCKCCSRSKPFENRSSHQQV